MRKGFRYRANSNELSLPSKIAVLFKTSIQSALEFSRAGSNQALCRVHSCMKKSTHTLRVRFFASFESDNGRVENMKVVPASVEASAVVLHATIQLLQHTKQLLPHLKP